MARRKKHARKSVGAPPGSLMFIGEQKVEQVTVDLVDFSAEQFAETEKTEVPSCRKFRDSPSVTWFHVRGLHDVGVVEKLGACFDLPPLVMEDILNTRQRPKLEAVGDLVFVVVKAIRSLDNPAGEHVCIVCGPRFVLSFQETADDLFGPVRKRIRSPESRMRKAGTDYLTYALVDTIVDLTFPALEEIEDQAETLEEELLGEPTADVLRRVHALRNTCLVLRRTIRPLRDVVFELRRTDSPLFAESILPFLLDTHDHASQAMDELETTRERIGGMIDLYMNTASFRMNEVMKVLTIVATVFIPLTFIAGIYGMNFTYMPELHYRWGYPAVWGVMVAVVVGMVVYFRRKKWF